MVNGDPVFAHRHDTKKLLIVFSTPTHGYSIWKTVGLGTSAGYDGANNTRLVRCVGPVQATWELDDPVLTQTHYALVILSGAALPVSFTLYGGFAYTWVGDGSQGTDACTISATFDGANKTKNNTIHSPATINDPPASAYQVIGTITINADLTWSLT
jgi:hypothetical protein